MTWHDMLKLSLRPWRAARVLFRRQRTGAESLEFFLVPAVDDVERRAPAANAVERGRELGHHLRRDDAGMDRDHKLHLAGQRRHCGRQQPSGVIGAKPTL